MFRTVKKSLALLSLIGVAAGSSLAAPTVYVDTIGPGSKYQLGRDVTQSMQVGFNAYPASNEFTGVRPTFGSTGVTAYGTSGVQCAEVWSSPSAGKLDPSIGSNGAWLAQPFVPATSGVITGVSLVARKGVSAVIWPDSAARTDNNLKVRAWIAAAAPPYASLTGTPAEIWFGDANVGTIINGICPGVSVTGGNTYYLVVGVGGHGSWTLPRESYCNLNWTWLATAPDSTRVAAVKYNNSNGLGDFWTAENRVMGMKLTGFAQNPDEVASVADAKKKADGIRVSIAGTVITGNGGAFAPGFFYVEDENRITGIKVVGSTGWSRNDLVQVVGTMATDPVTQERFIELEDCAPTGQESAVAPWGMTTTSVGGDACEGRLGQRTAGLVVKVAGLISDKSGSEFYVSDGGSFSGVDSKVKCVATGIASGSLPSNGDVRAITGVITLVDDAGSIKPVLLVRDKSDISAKLN